MHGIMLASTVLLILAATTPSPASARSADPYRTAAGALVEGEQFRCAKASIDKDYDRIVEDIITLTEVPAPPFGEQARAALNGIGIIRIETRRGSKTMIRNISGRRLPVIEGGS
ncbi:hypothetical protein [Sphingomonas sp. SRS2]|uniref:hypothetical protein n=1 Tax=Sphingomonas sp. SRS2 TaxID=133190 RepID=UPI0006183ED2|nr:hypothetical protein [Sphingomonas sp. SRS2]KKC25566.1 hypothetical protein WP12_13450 [Sphingomonas sp. SRS2]